MAPSLSQAVAAALPASAARSGSTLQHLAVLSSAEGLLGLVS